MQTLTEAPHTPSQWAYIDASPSFSPHRPSTRERSGVLHHTRGMPSRARIQPNGQCQRPCSGGPCRSKHWARSLGGRQAGPPPLLLAHAPRQAAHWRVDSDTAGSIAENRRAILGRTFPFDSGTTPPSSSKRPHTTGSSNVATSPGVRPLGGNRADPPLPPRHTQPAFRTCGGQQPTEGSFKRDGSMAVDRRATLGHVPLTIENDHVAPMHGSKEALRPRSPISAPFW